MDNILNGAEALWLKAATLKHPLPTLSSLLCYSVMAGWPITPSCLLVPWQLFNCMVNKRWHFDDIMTLGQTWYVRGPYHVRVICWGVFFPSRFLYDVMLCTLGEAATKGKLGQTHWGMGKWFHVSGDPLGQWRNTSYMMVLRKTRHSNPIFSATHLPPFLSISLSL